LAAKVASQNAQRKDRDKVDERHDTSVQFKPNERVLLHRAGILPKLAVEWEGPFRVARSLGTDNYELRDLHSRRGHPSIHVSRLRPYLTITDEEKLAPDEFIVDYLMDRRDVKLPNGRTQRQYKVKWRGYPRAEASWQPREGLMLREKLAEEVKAMDAEKDASTTAPGTAREPVQPPAPAPAPEPAPSSTEKTEPTHPPPSTADRTSTQADSSFPSAAKMVKGVWHYQFEPTADNRLSRVGQARWYPAYKFTAEELTQFSHIHPAMPAAPVFVTARRSHRRILDASTACVHVRHFRHM
jgi:hypothetical protein